jgi:antirestriction protein ArdC
MTAKAYEKVTARLIALIEEKGEIPWHKPWGSAAGFAAGRSLRSGKLYRGINALLTTFQGYDDPRWVTRKHLKELGGLIRKGEKGTPILYWNFTEKEDEKGETKKRAFARVYYAWNVEQCEIPEGAIPQLEGRSEPAPFEEHTTCDDVIRGMPKRPVIEHLGGRACYSPAFDRITMPRRESFDSPEHYYSTLFHELGHSTAHESRLARKASLSDWTSFGTAAYAREELIAELTAAFLCGVTGIENQPLIENNAAYLANWLKRLKEDASLIPLAAQGAQKAADYILELQSEYANA